MPWPQSLLSFAASVPLRTDLSCWQVWFLQFSGTIYPARKRWSAILMRKMLSCSHVLRCSQYCHDRHSSHAFCCTLLGELNFQDNYFTRLLISSFPNHSLILDSLNPTVAFCMTCQKQLEHREFSKSLSFYQKGNLVLVNVMQEPIGRLSLMISIGLNYLGYNYLSHNYLSHNYTSK